MCWTSFGIHGNSMGNFSGISLEFVGKSDVFVWECVGNAHGAAGEWAGNWSGTITNYLGNSWYSYGLLENSLGICREFLRIIWETVGIHREPLENLWGLSVRNTFVGRGPNTNRAHPHACNIPYKTALPVPCTHRFYFSLFLVIVELPFFVSFLGGFLDCLLYTSPSPRD